MVSSFQEFLDAPRFLRAKKAKFIAFFESILQARTITKHDLTKVAGKVNWLSSLFVQARPFAAPLFKEMKLFRSEYQHRALSEELKRALQFWIDAVSAAILVTRWIECAGRTNDWCLRVIT